MGKMKIMQKNDVAIGDGAPITAASIASHSRRPSLVHWLQSITTWNAKSHQIAQEILIIHFAITAIESGGPMFCQRSGPLCCRFRVILHLHITAFIVRFVRLLATWDALFLPNPMWLSKFKLFPKTSTFPTYETFMIPKSERNCGETWIAYHNLSCIRSCIQLPSKCLPIG